MAKHKQLEAVHAAADYYEPLFRARFARAMKAVRKTVSVEDIARAIRLRQPTIIPRAVFEKALVPCANVVRDAVVRGGQLGAEKVKLK